MQKELEKIKAKFIWAVYEGSNGYCIYSYENVNTGEKVTCIGNYLPQNKNLCYEITGEWKKTERHGLNFTVQNYKEIIENTRTGIIAYLSSVISGIGKVTAERIYDKFGNNSISIIETNPEKLLAVKGITEKKLKKIVDSYREKFVLRELTEFLLPFGITTKQTVKLYNEEQIDSINALKEAPYKLCNIYGISVHTADLVAKHFGYSENYKERLIAHVNYILCENESSGSTGMEANEFGTALLRSLASRCYTRENITQYTVNMIKEGIISCKKIQYDQQLKTIIFRPVSYKTEMKIADKLIKLSKEKQETHKNISEFLADYSNKNGVKLDDEQSNAIKTAVTNSVTVITGGPGTGKTTIIKAIADYLSKEEHGALYFMAPSGRAARRITESTGYSATTIHKGINYRPGEIYKDKEDKISFINSTIVVDEFSMVGTFLTNILLDCIELGCRLIIVGDVNQLQSVEAGAVLRDIINSNTVPVIKLAHVHRQSDDSMIYLNAQKIVKGQHDILEGSDFKMIQCSSPEEAQAKMIDSYMEYVKLYGVQSLYCLCPCKERAAGVKIMNTSLQENINPLKAGDREFKALGTSYRVGDPVMHLKNSLEVSNGDIGYVTKIFDNEGTKSMIVTYFGDAEIEYTADEAEDITLAYAFTVHKAQGSENKIIITYLSKTLGKNMLKRNLVNTSVTRGSQMVKMFLTNDNALYSAIDNDDSEKRITSLKYHMEYFGGQFVKVS